MHTPFQSASLYVGDLHPDVTEPFLYEVFREVGPITSIRVCRDNMSRASLGYAYVNFQNPVDAERALDTLNYSTVKNQPIRIMWSQRDPAVRKSGIGNVFIKNLDKSIDHKALYDTFSAFGNILSCKVCNSEVVKSKNDEEEEDESSCYGFVHFETAEAAEQAIAKVNGMSINGKEVYVGPFVRKQERMKTLSNVNEYTNIFVKNLDKSVSDDQLREMFVKFGEIQSCVIMRDEKDASKGFGFINFTDHEAAIAAVDEMNNKEVEGKKLYVGRAQKKNERQATLKEKFEKLKLERATKYQGVNVYVKNLDESIDEEQLKQEFAKFGEIQSCVVMRDEKGVSKGFGFVCFSQPEEAENAIKEMHSYMLAAKPLYVALAQRKEERKLQLEQQNRYKQGMQGMPPMGYAHPPHVIYPHGMPVARGGFGYPPQGMVQPPKWQRGRGGAPSTGPFPQQPPQSNFTRGGSVATRGARGAAASGRGSQRGRGTDRGYKYNPTARNTRPDQSPTNATPQMQQPATVVQPQETDTLSPAYLAQLNPQQQKQILGEKLFYLVSSRNQEHAPKITGMLLDMEVGDILHLLEDSQALELKINEAISVLKEHEELEGDAQVADQE